MILFSFKGAVNGMFVVPPCSIYLRLLFVLLTNANRLKFKDVIHSKYFETSCTFKSYSTSQWLHSPIPKIKEHLTLFTLSSMNLMNYRFFLGKKKNNLLCTKFYFKRVAWSWPFSNYINLFFTRITL